MSWLDNLIGVGNLPDEVAAPSQNFNWADYLNQQLTSQPLPQVEGTAAEEYLKDVANPYGPYSNYGADTLSAMGATNDTNASAAGSASKLGDFFKSMGGKALNFAQTPQGLMALIAALAGAAGRQRATGGGTTMGMMAPRQYTRSVDPRGIVRYAAEGGLMHAYAHGGEAQAYAGGKPLVMEDGGFVFTEEATRKLRPQGIAALGGKMISAPGNGTNDKGITGIIGKHGTTPARVSNGESYFPKEAVEANGGPKRMYAAMNKLQRKA